MSRYARVKPNYLRAHEVSPNVHVPDQIKCLRCSKVKAKVHYSEKQVATLRAKIAAHGRFDAEKEGYIPCRDCTGGQVQELECIICGDFKSLDEFAKVQRKLGKNSDNATCLTCQSGIAKTRPHGDEHFDQVEDDNEEQGDDVFSETSSVSNIYQTSSDAALSGIENLSIKDATSSTQDTSQGSRISVAPGWTVQRPRGYVASTPSVISTSTSIAPGFDPHKYGAPSASVSVSGGGKAAYGPARTGASSGSGSAISSSPSTANLAKSKGKWAKPYNPNGKFYDDGPFAHLVDKALRADDESEGEY